MKRIILALILILIILLFNLLRLYWIEYEVIETMSGRVNKPNFYIIADLDVNRLYLYQDGELIKEYPISSGKASTPSPLGTWKIISKKDWGEGFGGTWMGFNVPWGEYGIHGTDEPWSIGSDLSKGCIRLYNDDANELQKLVPIGTKVTVIEGPYGPFGAGFRKLKPGNRGADVYMIQTRLKELGYYPNWVDGIYGRSMELSVLKFQKEKGLTRSKYITKEFYLALGFELFE